METIQRIQSFEHLKTLADSRRLEILQMLMSAPQTLSTLGKALGEHPAKVRHHLKQLEKAGLVELVETRVVRGFVEKYYRANAHVFLFHEIILPSDVAREKDVLLAFCSHDLALDGLIDHMLQSHGQRGVVAVPVGSLDSLVALRQGMAQIAGCHLLDAESGQYNTPFVSRFFPDRPVSLVTLAYREQGLLLAPGREPRIRGLEDLANPEVTFVNRNPGSGTRIWLDGQLAHLGIPGLQIHGYTHEVRTHTQVAAAIAQGQADAGLGLLAAARRFQLDFIPLFQERYDLVIPQENLEKHPLQALLDHLNSAEFAQVAASLGGYDTSQTGRQTSWPHT